MNVACPQCDGGLFFHAVEAKRPADQGLVVHAIGSPERMRVFRGSIPSEVPCPHCGAAVVVPRSTPAAVDAILDGLNGESFGW